MTDQAFEEAWAGICAQWRYTDIQKAVLKKRSKHLPLESFIVAIEQVVYQTPGGVTPALKTFVSIAAQHHEAQRTAERSAELRASESQEQDTRRSFNLSSWLTRYEQKQRDQHTVTRNARIGPVFDSTERKRRK